MDERVKNHLLPVPRYRMARLHRRRTDRHQQPVLQGKLIVRVFKADPPVVRSPVFVRDVVPADYGHSSQKGCYAGDDGVTT